ncbi:MAG: hypothetical protein K2Z81_24440 [Cyanobacteria bacterium]|nr:hypothetical protein [Cyanobacteriota bacterium]
MWKTTCLFIVSIFVMTSSASAPVLGADGSDGEGRKRYNGTVQKPESSQSKSSGETDIHEPLSLMVHMTAGSNGDKMDIQPVYESKNGMTQEKYNNLLKSPLVQTRLDEWKSWMTNLFEETRPNKDAKIPDDLREKISLSVTKKGKVTATKEWMDPTDNEGTKHFSEKFLTRLSNLKPALLKFPTDSYIELVKLDVFLKGHDNEYEIMTGSDLKLDYDHD